MCREKAIENIFLLVLGFRTFSHSLDPERTSGLNDSVMVKPRSLLIFKSGPFGDWSVFESEHRARLIALGYMVDLSGRLRMTTPASQSAA